MYEVERLSTQTGETIVVRKNGKHVAAASIRFVRWLQERVPRKQLRPELVALVDWYEVSSREGKSGRAPAQHRRVSLSVPVPPVT